MFAIVASDNGASGIAVAVPVLRDGGSALDAVEAATRTVEADPSDHTVGLGGYPNIAGDVELDASIMEGGGRRAGAVAALRGYLHPISVARAILERLPHHVLLVGDGAALFAEEIGCDRAELLTDKAAAIWRSQLARIDKSRPLAVQTREARDPEKMVGTVNFLAVDAAGRMASAVSTSGWSFKYPGRTGDSPIIGAGNYCDNRFGAAACTGIGEWAIRASTARMVVARLEFGMSLEDACRQAFADLGSIPLPSKIAPTMNLVALTPDGQHTGLSTAPGRRYLWASDTHPQPQLADRMHVTVVID